MGYETYRLGALSGTRQVLDAVIREQPERFMEPCRTPPLPAETPPIPRPHQMAPHLRVDLSDQRLDRLGLEASEPLLELPQQRRALLPLRRVLRPASVRAASAPAGSQSPRIQSSPPDSGPRSDSSPRSAAHRVSPTPLGAAGAPPPSASPADDRCSRGSPSRRHSARTRRTCAYR